jgi:tRNA U55 pseudouridine synthase TruB
VGGALDGGIEPGALGVGDHLGDPAHVVELERLAAGQPRIDAAVALAEELAALVVGHLHHAVEEHVEQ